MLTTSEILELIESDKTSERKLRAVEGQRYYEGDHDIKNYQLYYIDANGNAVQDTNRSNIKISHPFFTELVDQAAQYVLSNPNGFVLSDIPELQAQLDKYFNKNEDFKAELYEFTIGVSSKGLEYMYAYKKEDGITSFQCADCIGVVEARAKDTSDNTDYIIYWYIDRIEKGQKKIKRIEVWDKKQTYYYVQSQDGVIEFDTEMDINPRPHIVKTDEEGNMYDGGSYGVIPFFRMDNCRKQFSDLKPIKDLIDDYDLMSCGLSNNLEDASEYLVVVKGFQGDDMETLMNNIKTKKHIGINSDDNAGVEFKTVDIPYEARRTKMEIDEKNIYRFGFGLNTAGLKDTNATTNIGIKAAYSLLDMKATKLEIRLKQFLRKLLKLVIAEINEEQGTDYQVSQVYFDFTHDILANAQENAQIALTEAQEQQARINTLLALQTELDNETLMQNICDVLEIDYNEIKDRLPDPLEAQNSLLVAQNNFDNAIPVGVGGEDGE